MRTWRSDRSRDERGLEQLFDALVGMKADGVPGRWVPVRRGAHCIEVTLRTMYPERERLGRTTTAFAHPRWRHHSCHALVGACMAARIQDAPLANDVVYDHANVVPPPLHLFGCVDD